MTEDEKKGLMACMVIFAIGYAIGFLVGIW